MTSNQSENEIVNTVKNMHHVLTMLCREAKKTLKINLEIIH